jgi:hypothetical protein
MSRHKGRTACAAQKAMSALPPKADVRLRSQGHGVCRMGGGGSGFHGG